MVGDPARGVTKVYSDGTEAVSAINLEIAYCEYVVTLNPSGCGKTSVLRLVATLEEIRKARRLFRRLCEHVDMRLGRFGADVVDLRFAVHGHLRGLIRTGRVRLLDPAERPPRLQRADTAAT
jgi:energy-coupling factor transporter ATP-binding protein EcfA2